VGCTHADPLFLGLKERHGPKARRVKGTYRVTNTLFIFYGESPVGRYCIIFTIAYVKVFFTFNGFKI
jgi:hypothetical protein